MHLYTFIMNKAIKLIQRSYSSLSHHLRFMRCELQIIFAAIDTMLLQLFKFFLLIGSFLFFTQVFDTSSVIQSPPAMTKLQPFSFAAKFLQIHPLYFEKLSEFMSSDMNPLGLVRFGEALECIIISSKLIKRVNYLGDNVFSLCGCMT